MRKNPVTVARQIDYTCRQLWGKVLFGGMHPICQILNNDVRKEFPNRRTEHIHVSFHLVDGPIQASTHLVDAPRRWRWWNQRWCSGLFYRHVYIMFHLILNSLVKEVEAHHTTSCRKRKRVNCQFSAPWPPSERTF